MPVVGFNLNKISGEKLNKVDKKISVNNQFKITSITKSKGSLDSTEFLEFGFDYNVEYKPSVGNINLSGKVAYTDDSKKLKDILKEWEKDKKIDPKLMQNILNVILIQCGIKSLGLSQDLNLPPHISLPTIKPAKSAKDYIG